MTPETPLLRPSSGAAAHSPVSGTEDSGPPSPAEVFAAIETLIAASYHEDITLTELLDEVCMGYFPGIDPDTLSDDAQAELFGLDIDTHPATRYVFVADEVMA